MERIEIQNESMCTKELIIALAGTLHNKIGKRLNKKQADFEREIAETLIKNNLNVRDLGNFQFWFNYFMSGHGHKKSHQSKLEALPAREAATHIAQDGYKKHRRQSRNGRSKIRDNLKRRPIES